MPKKFYPALAALLFILMALSFLPSFLPVHGEADIYDTVVRLHILANSDSDEDQALKLRVRDAVLAVTADDLDLSACTDRDTAAARLSAMTDSIREAAEAVISAEGRDDLAGTVTVLLGEEAYPTRTYGDCTLPAGTYLSLRVCIGEAAGHNWWCVMFPPLCLSAASADKKTAEDAFISVGLTKDQYAVITETDNVKYRARFKILELWEKWFK